ncbi:hypothetical protein F7734_44120 [Scytonema sp. UIC 10036]|uniref:hypothetical protein n=1 Tax=Scytonema sp. UIC 10036 TaxID=2304196 RepID=UPI0012DADE62|nr:hypothetical protein [Scytonema sp. UIC 10036]MUG98913.1 hypothetical protein [Scytonema sp. UIC 10036]
MTQQAQKLQDIKNMAYAIARSLGLKLTQTRHFKRHCGQGLDLRTKRGWLMLCVRLRSLANGVVVSLFLQSQAAA